MIDGRSIETWFTTDQPVPAGPELYGGLPGIILLLDIEHPEGQITYSASQVKLKTTIKIIPPLRLGSHT